MENTARNRAFVVFSCLLILQGCSAAHSSKEYKCDSNNRAEMIINEEAAYCIGTAFIAENMSIAQYNEYRPYTVQKLGEGWVVSGSFNHKGSDGGVPSVRISKEGEVGKIELEV